MSSNARTATLVGTALIVLIVVAFLVLGRPATVPTTPQASASALPTTAVTSPTSTPLPTASSAPVATTAPGPRATAEQAADALAAALQASDFAALEPLITPNGFNWAKSGSGGLTPKSPQETIEFLRAESGGRLQITVASRPIKASTVPWGPRAIESTWRGFGNVPQQAIDLVLHEVGGRWYWAGGFITG
jgi:hypothetical protein